MSLDRFRLWFMLLPCLSLYLVTNRGFKGMLLMPAAWMAMDLAANWRHLRDRMQMRSFHALLAYVFLAGSAVMSGALVGEEKILLRDVMILGTSLAMFMFPKADINAPKWLFACFALAYVQGLVGKNFSLSQLGDLFTLKLFLPSTSSTEYDFGIVFGLFSVHFLMTRSWAFFLPSALVSLMVSKRALLVGFLVSAAWWFLFGRSERISPKVKSGLMAALYAGLMVFSLFMAELGRMVLGWFSITNISVGNFLMGRNSLITALRSKMDSDSPTAYFGHGPGSADTFLASNGVGWGPITDTPFNPHNDYMKIFFDYGILGYLVFFWILLNFYGATSKGKALMAYTITVFCFDNSLIFMVYHVVAGFMCAEYVRLEKDARLSDV
jgi:hypothetical protein